MSYPPPLEPSFKPSLSAGFTLVEIAIVLVIIGLIVGGVMVGAELIRVAQIHSQISQLDKYRTSVRVFYMKYNCIPGDCAVAIENGLGQSGGGRAKTEMAMASFLATRRGQHRP